MLPLELTERSAGFLGLLTNIYCLEFCEEKEAAPIECVFLTCVFFEATVWKESLLKDYCFFEAFLVLSGY